MPAKKSTGSTPVEATVHKTAKRKNIPTPELDRFLDNEARAPKTLRYPRDPSLDPQLVWKGKDDQDGNDLEVQARPIYIQEKIDPRVIIANLRNEQRTQQSQAELFADFNGISFEDQVNFYQHQQNWQNRLILGDSLQVMASLSEKEGLKGQVQCVYMDPPYGIKFGSNWQVSTQKRVVKDGNVQDASPQPEQVKAFRDTWELGVHSYLSYLRDRLTAAHDLLTDSGSLFVQIGEENLHLVRSVIDEVFGAENYCCLFAFRTKIPLRTTLVPSIYDYVIWYARNKGSVKFRRLFKKRDLGAGSQFTWVEEPDGSRRRMTEEEAARPALLTSGFRPFRLTDLVSAGRTESCVFEFEFDGRKFFPSGGKSWKTNKAGIERLKELKRIMAPAGMPAYVFYADDYPVQELDNVWTDTQGASDRIYVVQTSTKVVERCILMSTDPGDLVLDPMTGSGTVPYSSEQWGRRWIGVDTSRVAVTLARQRLMSARYPYYVLADNATPVGDIRKGFVYRQVPHITLGSFTSAVVEITSPSGPEDAPEASPTNSEVLLDQPETDRGVVRVTGPFTVESLSPYRAITQGSDSAAPTSGHRVGLDADGKFEQTILKNLAVAGVQNNKKGARLTFRGVEPWPGEYVHAVGEYDDADGVKRAAICIGPEHGTVGEPLVREAAKEAAGDFDVLIVCGFAFEPSVGEDTKRYGSLTVLKASMNPDLQFGGDILKKRASDNLFTVFGEPDIDVRVTGDDVVVEVKGVDIYDPTTGDVRSDRADGIACWFIDTNYNTEAFFVRHAYFTGDRAKDPYEQLRKALRAEIDEAAWESLYQTVSRPFPRPKTGKIAVKVISHYGDEVMKVCEL